MGVSISDLSMQLMQNINNILNHYGIEYKNSGGRLNFLCPWAGDDYSKIDMRIKHPIGQWKRWNGNEAGDIFDFIAYMEGNGTRDRAGAYKWACEFFGINNQKLSEIEQKKQNEIWEKRRIENEKRASIAEEKWQEKLKKDRGRAFAIFLRAKKLQKNDLVWQYLSERGIELEALPEIPSSIRLLENEQHKCSETGKITYWPCMVSAMWFRDGQFAALHRTWFDLKSAKTNFKAPVLGAKKMWPSNAGAFIPIARGRTKLAAKDAMPKSEAVYIFEGIENALSFAMLRPECRIDVAGSLSMIKNYPAPQCANALYIGADKFDNIKAQKALDAIINSQKLKTGLDVRVNFAPANFKDWNAAIMGQNNG